MGADADDEDDPFRSSGGKTAVKVIDQTGKEHMTVIDNPENMLELNQE